MSNSQILGFSAGKRFGGNGIQPAAIGTGCFCTGDVGKGRNDIPMAWTPPDDGAGGRGRAAGCVSRPQSRAGALSFCGDRSVTRQRRRERGKDAVLAQFLPCRKSREKAEPPSS